MNPLIAFLLVFSALGALDKLLGGRFGLAGDFDKGLSSMGPLCLSMAGVYCAAVTVSEKLEALERVPALASLAAGCVLAPDLGGTAVCAALSSSGPEAVFTGVLVSSTLGCLVSFVLPISLGTLRGEAAKEYLRGAAAQRLGVSREAAAGLAVSFATSLSMLPLFDKMDARGKAVNAAFSVGGAFCLGGQLAFVASAAPASVGAYLVCKLAAGACGALLAAKTTPRANGEVSA